MRTGQENKQPPTGNQRTGHAPKKAQQSPVKQRIANGLVALSTAAVVAIYAAGYVQTTQAANSVANITLPTAITITATAPATVTGDVALSAAAMPTATATSSTLPTATTTTAAPTATSTTIATTVPTATSTTAASTAATSAAATTAAYRDGTYTGTGTSKHGDVTVAVVVKNGVISSVEIIASTTRYPISRIASLPGAVVSAQSAQVNIVSGATDSSTAFITAVTSALAQAKNA